MKRILVTLMALAVGAASLTPAVAQTQPGDWQARVGAGFFSVPDYVGLILVAFGSIDTNENISHKDFVPLTSINADFNYQKNAWFSWGGKLSFGCAMASSHFNDTGATSRSVTVAYPTLLVGAKTRYFRSGIFEMYGSWGAGATLLVMDQYTSDSEPNFQMRLFPMADLYPVSFSLGRKNGFFAEIGWGSKGMVNMGGYFSF